MTDKLNAEKVRALLDRATKGPWSNRGLRDHEWSVDTDGNNTVQFIGPKGKLPVCAAIVNAAFGKDHILDANAALIALAPDLADAYLEAMAVIAEFAADENWRVNGKFDPESSRFDNSAARAFLAKHKE